MKTYLNLISFLFIILITTTVYSQESDPPKLDSLKYKKYKTGIGPSILASITQLKMNGDYEVFSAGFGVGVSLKRTNFYDGSYGNVPWEIGVYISPRFSQNKDQSKGELSVVLHSTIYESFGLGIGVNVWKTGQGLVEAYKEDVFITLGYSLTNETEKSKNE
jgi:hypothetical protein